MGLRVHFQAAFLPQVVGEIHFLMVRLRTDCFFKTSKGGSPAAWAGVAVFCKYVPVITYSPAVSSQSRVLFTLQTGGCECPEAAPARVTSVCLLHGL